MSDVKISLGVLHRISEFLADLPEDQLAALADGSARLAYIPVGADEPAPAGRAPRSRGGTGRPPFTPSQATTDLLERFDTFNHRDEASSALAHLKKPALLDIAKALSVPGSTKLTMDELRREIVEATVGRRLDSIAIRGFDGPRP
jgi:hypothetical protein